MTLEDAIAVGIWIGLFCLIVIAELTIPILLIWVIARGLGVW
jgi:hypothetical protein